jgi:hypothetical protein
MKRYLLKDSIIFFIISFAFSCGRGLNIQVIAPQKAEFLKEFADEIPEVKFKFCDEPSKCTEEGINIIVEEADCDECYQLIERDGNFVVKGGFPLGIIYGLTHMLEIAGFGFPHPFYHVSPENVDIKSVREKIAEIDGNLFKPEIPQRGIHLHTLHPVEGLFSFWMGSPEGLKEAFKIVRWVAMQRGNFIKWVSLNDIYNDAKYEKWKEHTSRILNYIHKLGMKAGIGVELFASSNFQRAYLANKGEDIEKILALPFDSIDLSFGEFIGNEPSTFIEKVNNVYEEIKGINKDIEVSATIHVGNFENLFVEYNGERLLYYFLVKYCNENIIPLVHTVMFYNLFDDAGGAYNHDDFSMHRDFLFEMLEKKRKAGYFPETAYWIAFDNSVPLYLPIYILSRWIDLKGIREKGNLYSHIIFSSGWEWGYWLNDYSSLRFSYSLPVTWTEPLNELFNPSEREIIKRLTEMEYEYLIKKRLTPYLSGEDFYVYLGCTTKLFFSQPCRIPFKELILMGSEEKEKFLQDVLIPLENMENEMDSLLEIFKSSSYPISAELNDGVEITCLRIKFIKNLYMAVLMYSENKDFSENFENALKALEKAKEVVKRRSEKFFYPRPAILINPIPNPTIYPFGYLKQAHSLCLWERDLDYAKISLGMDTDFIPSCIN